ncbi:uncharacterized protein ASCRUDRAFT_82429 [Ascoidea rubescens DSM 1968]|uniref:Uncharacterized protein n=1 Tax=Ascoidea rubescens DSM 1968 TaxID=1344418 RepID=A0A1D2VBP2_9ASCO|nr:hypothetical protein ASCRUDRAFT_82429 [Ascoidea rubescens DSM 1968]ODV59114.1 hypothetical protein ASCRUDRAFT_82429 [Ascoidea rubescens DSM 1968]
MFLKNSICGYMFEKLLTKSTILNNDKSIEMKITINKKDKIMRKDLKNFNNHTKFNSAVKFDMAVDNKT